jgi:hypothetical protein
VLICLVRNLAPLRRVLFFFFLHGTFCRCVAHAGLRFLGLFTFLLFSFHLPHAMAEPRVVGFDLNVRLEEDENGNLAFDLNDAILDNGNGNGNLFPSSHFVLFFFDIQSNNV